MLSKVLLDSTPEKLNEIEFAVKFWKHDTEMACRFNGFLHQGFLLLEIGLPLSHLPLVPNPHQNHHFLLWKN